MGKFGHFLSFVLIGCIAADKRFSFASASRWSNRRKEYISVQSRTSGRLFVEGVHES